jgi:hypothetical protein
MTGIVVTCQSGVQRNRERWRENVEDDDAEPRHLEGLTRRATLKLMELVADGDLESVEARSWAPGYGDGSAI